MTFAITPDLDAASEEGAPAGSVLLSEALRDALAVLAADSTATPLAAPFAGHTSIIEARHRLSDEVADDDDDGDDDWDDDEDEDDDWDDDDDEDDDWDDDDDEDDDDWDDDDEDEDDDWDDDDEDDDDWDDEDEDDDL